ncbi:hypothetical protein GQ457_07G015060 [Hibiscus cannabinus]
MEECRIILAEQDNLLTFSESQDRCHLGLRRLIGVKTLFFPTSKMEECRIILAEQDNLLTFSESQDRVKTLFFPTSKMEECRIILAEQDNLLTFSESQDRCHLGLRRLIRLEISNTGREQSCRMLQPEGKHEEKGRIANLVTPETNTS